MGMSKENYLTLDPDTRAFTLVGAFMGFFALLEQGVDSAMTDVLEIKGLRGTIVARNMSFDDKIKTLRTLVDIFVSNETEAKKFDELARKAKKIGETRNIVAHTPFRRSSKSDGVQFFAYSATSTLKFLEMDWSVDEFLRQIDNINQTDNELRSIESRMAIQRVADALLRRQSPEYSSESMPLASLFGLGDRSV